MFPILKLILLYRYFTLLFPFFLLIIIMTSDQYKSLDDIMIDAKEYIITITKKGTLPSEMAFPLILKSLTTEYLDNIWKLTLVPTAVEFIVMMEKPGESWHFTDVISDGANFKFVAYHSANPTTKFTISVVKKKI